MAANSVSRRRFVAASGAIAGGSLTRAGLSALLGIAGAACTARDEGAAFEVLGRDEAREFEAIAARILPTTGTPGAREAGVIWFMDRSFATIMPDALDSARSGLGEFAAGIPEAFPGAQHFSDLDPADQDRYLETRETTSFFGLMRFLTLAGFFSMSSYGGNRNEVGWKLLGLQGAHNAWTPPFGFYDAQYLRDEPGDV